MKLEQTQGGAFKRVPLNETELAQIKEAEQAVALKYLADTDWIAAKYNDDVIVKGIISKDDYIAKYKDIYEARAKAREVLNASSQD